MYGIATDRVMPRIARVEFASALGQMHRVDERDAADTATLLRWFGNDLTASAHNRGPHKDVAVGQMSMPMDSASSASESQCSSAASTRPWLVASFALTVASFW